MMRPFALTGLFLLPALLWHGAAVPLGAAVAGPQRPSAAAQSSHVFREAFGAGWRERWMDQALGRRRTRYEVVLEDGRPVLRATSRQSASALWHPLGQRADGRGLIAWRWRVLASLSENEHERAKRGDDYAARLFVVFDSGQLSAHTQAICYVWAGREAIGAVYPSPYAPGVATIVVESGDQRANRWAAEQRDFVADYRRVFSRTPQTVAAVAIMVDTDNTGSTATAWFDSITVTTSGP